jgi:hypothetical protein
VSSTSVLLNSIFSGFATTIACRFLRETGGIVGVEAGSATSSALASWYDRSDERCPPLDRRRDDRSCSASSFLIKSPTRRSSVPPSSLFKGVSTFSSFKLSVFASLYQRCNDERKPFQPDHQSPPVHRKADLEIRRLVLFLQVPRSGNVNSSTQK